MHRLKIVRPQHHDDQRQRRVNLDPLRQTNETVSARLEGVIPRRTARIQAVLNNPHGQAAGMETILHHARPSCFESEPFPCHGDDSPRNRVSVNKNLLHHCFTSMTVSRRTESARGFFLS